MARTTPDLLIATPTSHHMTAHTAGSLLRTVRDARLRDRVEDVVLWLSGPLIANARNDIVRHFLATEAEWLLQVDADMNFDPEDLLRLLEAADPQDRPILGAMCAGTGQLRAGDPVLAEAGWLDAGGAYPVLAEPTGDVIEVDFTGAGMLLMHRSVFPTIAAAQPSVVAPWFAEAEHNGRLDGEDWEFCRRARAAGIPVHVHSGVCIGHLKSIVIMPRRGL